jgi:hypothetical protein
LGECVNFVRGIFICRVHFIVAVFGDFFDLGDALLGVSREGSVVVRFHVGQLFVGFGDLEGKLSVFL